MAKNYNKQKVTVKKKGNLFTFLEDNFKVDAVFEDGLPVKYLPYILHVTAIGIFYIGNSHYAEKTIRNIAKAQVEVEDLRADFTTLKADYMVDSKQSEVASKVEKIGLYESSTPPNKIVIKEGEY
ncbi:MAG: FtsL-like putative cell division protein [Bacteroidota bacterium]|nr:FtsL-like putative cell division protein [Bacteroidota bacterium]